MSASTVETKVYLDYKLKDNEKIAGYILHNRDIDDEGGWEYANEFYLFRISDFNNIIERLIQEKRVSIDHECIYHFTDGNRDFYYPDTDSRHELIEHVRVTGSIYIDGDKIKTDLKREPTKEIHRWRMNSVMVTDSFNIDTVIESYLGD